MTLDSDVASINGRRTEKFRRLWNENELCTVWVEVQLPSVKGEHIMTLSMRIAPHLPYLRRFSRAATGSQTSGDAYVAATLEALIADVSIFPEASSDRIALYKLFSKLFSSSAVNIPSPQPHFVWAKSCLPPSSE